MLGSLILPLANGVMEVLGLCRGGDERDERSQVIPKVRRLTGLDVEEEETLVLLP